MAVVNTERLLNTFLELVQIDSPSGAEAGVAAYCKETLEAAGCVVRFDDSSIITGSDVGNLFATLVAFGGEASLSSKPLYFSAHMDNVNPCTGVKPRVEGGFVYSDGTTVLGGDDKVGIAAIIETVRCLKEGEAQGEPHPEIRVLLSVREEQGLMGAKAMDITEFADAQGALCYVLDAAGKPGLVVNGAPYQHSYQARYTGLAAHAGIAPESGISAIRAAAKAVASLAQGRIDEQTTANVGTITGGTANNVVAEQCLVTGEIRSHDEDRLIAFEADVDKTLKAAAEDDGTGAGPVGVEVVWEVNYEGFFASEDSPEVTLALRAARKLGLEARTEVGDGGADTNILVSYGLAAISLGCGMERIHSTDERLAIQDLEDLARLTMSIVRESQRGV